MTEKLFRPSRKKKSDLRRFPNLTYPPLSSGAVALLVVMRMHDELCIGMRELGNGGASSNPGTVHVRTYSILIVRLHTRTRMAKTRTPEDSHTKFKTHSLSQHLTQYARAVPASGGSPNMTMLAACTTNTAYRVDPH